MPSSLDAALAFARGRQWEPTLAHLLAAFRAVRQRLARRSISNQSRKPARKLDRFHQWAYEA